MVGTGPSSVIDGVALHRIWRRTGPDVSSDPTPVKFNVMPSNAQPDPTPGRSRPNRTETLPTPPFYADILLAPEALRSDVLAGEPPERQTPEEGRVAHRGDRALDQIVDLRRGGQQPQPRVAVVGR